MISAYTAIVSIVALIAMHAVLAQIEHQNAAVELTILSASQKKFIDLNLKNAVRIALANAVGDGCEEKIHIAALKLAEMENFVENYYAAKGIKVNARSGWINENNQCIACFDLLTMQSEQVLYCNEAGKVVVSRSHVPLAEVIGKPAIGFTVIASRESLQDCKGGLLDSKQQQFNRITSAVCYKRGNDEWNSIIGEGFE